MIYRYNARNEKKFREAHPHAAYNRELCESERYRADWESALLAAAGLLAFSDHTSARSRSRAPVGIAVKTINHLGDEVVKVFSVR